MSDDWLQHGHEIDSAELTTVLSSSSLLADRAGAPPPRGVTWRAVATGGAIALLATLGVAGVANALGDNLFPSMGPTSPASVWQNPVPPTEPEPDDDVASTAAPTTTAPPTTSPVPTTGPATPTTPVTTTAAAQGAVTSAPTTSDPRRDGDDDEDGADDVAVTTVPTPSDDLDSDDDGSSSGSGSSGSSGSGSSGSGSSGSGSGDSSDDD